MSTSNTNNNALPLRPVAIAGLLAIAAAPASAIEVVPTSDAFALANTLFLNIPLVANNVAYSGQFGQAGIYTNSVGTYGLPVSGIVLSSGNVSDYASGPNTSTGNTTAFNIPATQDQNDLLSPITGQPFHNDVSQLDIQFFNPTSSNTATFFATFGSEEFDE